MPPHERILHDILDELKAVKKRLKLVEAQLEELMHPEGEEERTAYRRGYAAGYRAAQRGREARPNPKIGSHEHIRLESVGS